MASGRAGSGARVVTRPRVVTLGETMGLLRATEIGSLAHASHLAVGVGGAESNVAIGLQRLGVDASWLGRVGDDGLGRRVTREIRAEGVDVRAVVDSGAATGLMLKERPSAASAAVTYYRRGSAGSRLTPEDLPSGWVEEASLLHVTGITPLLSASADATVHAAIDRAAAAGVPVSVDVNYRSALAPPGDAADVFRPLAARAQIVFGGDEELRLLADGDDIAEVARQIRGSRDCLVVLKDGERGATAFAEETAAAPAFPISPLDTVGAGDAFVAGFLSAHLAGETLEAALRRANACGAMACLVPGDWESAPTRDELARFLAGDADPVRR
ncbi:sugar kinase [Microbacterium sp. TNHR37B]|uniref:sugar kinase n=1 Tax=Microbacterium sp. TNHR37B TaxID=1775956 RepID=UPI0008303859|nr:sugar kinase [Microbacterium sp. TNHR37B]